MESLVLPFISKTLPPKLPKHWVRRAHLLEKLDASLAQRLLVMWAPAGYGKTTLLVDFASRLDRSTCWYSFLPEDREPAEFLAYCVKAIQRRWPEFGVRSCRLEQVLGSPDWLRSLGLFTSALQNEIHEDLVLILDDVHHTDSKPDLCKALSLLVERAPQQVRIIISSRTRPLLNCLPRLISGQEVAWLTTEDLRFTPQEAAEMLAKMVQTGVRADDVRDLVCRTEGWVTGIVLAGGLGGKASPGAAALVHDVLFDYQTSEIFDELPVTLRYFLLRTGVLPEFTPEFCNTLLRITNAHELLLEMQRRGLLIQEMPSPQIAYRYHDLFREYLERRFGLECSQEYREVSLRAAELFKAQGKLSLAIGLWHKAGALGEITQAIKDVAETYFDRGLWQTLDDWLALLPVEATDNDVSLGMLRARVRLRLGDPVGAMQQVDSILASSAKVDGLTEGEALSLKSSACRLLGMLEAACAAAEKATQLIRASNGNTQQLAEAYRQLASAQATQGRLQQAQRSFDMALELSAGSNLQLETLVHDGLAAVHGEQGKLDEAAFHLERARRGWARLGNQGALADTLNNLCNLHYCQGEFELALEEVEEAVHLATASSYLRGLATALVSRGMVLRALGKLSQALSNFEDGLARAREAQDSRLVADATYFLGDCFRSLGEPGRGEVFLKGALAEAEKSGQSYFAARCHLSLAQVYGTTRRFLDACLELDTARHLFAQAGSRMAVAQAEFWHGYLLFKHGKVNEALGKLEDVAVLVEDLGYFGFLLAESQDTLEFVRLGAAKHVGKGLYLRLLQRAVERARPTSPPHVSLDMLPRLKAFAFGQEGVILDEHEIGDQEWGSRKAKELLFLLLYKSRPVGREEIFDALWPETALDDSYSVLKTTVYRLRRATYSEFVQACGQGYRVNTSAPVEFDVSSFEEHLRQAELLEKGSERRRDHLEQATALYKGPFLPEFYSEWCETLRRELETRYHRSLVILAGYYAAKGDFDRSCELLRVVLSADPLDEEANYQLVLNQCKAGEHVSGLKHLRHYEKLLMEELGCPLPPRFSQLASHPFSASTA